MTENEKNKIKNLLYAWGSYKYIISAEKSELEDIKMMYKNMTDIKAVCIDGVPKGNKIKKPVEEAFEKNVRLCESRLEKLNKLIKSNMESKKKIDDIVDSFTYVEQYILKARYVKNLSWDVMPLNLPFTMCKRHCQRWHNQSLEKIYNELKKQGEFD